MEETSLSPSDPNQVRSQLYCQIADLVAGSAAEDETLFEELCGIVSEAHCAIEEVRKRMMRDFNRHGQFWKGEPAGESYDAVALSDSLKEHIHDIGQITSSPQRNKRAAIFAIAVLFDVVKRTLELAKDMEPPTAVFGEAIERAVREIEAFPEDVSQRVHPTMQTARETSLRESKVAYANTRCCRFCRATKTASEKSCTILKMPRPGRRICRPT